MENPTPRLPRQLDDRVDSRIDVRSKLADLAGESDPMRKFESVMQGLGAIRERNPLFKSMTPEQARSFTLVFGLVLFLHSLEKRQRDAKTRRDDAEADKLAAEAEKVRAEARALEQRVPNAANLERNLFVDASHAARLQTLFQTAVETTLSRGRSGDSENVGLAKGVTLYVAGSGDLVIDLSEPLYDRIQSLHRSGGEPAFRELAAADLKRETQLGGKTVYRAVFEARDLADRERFQRLLGALGLNAEERSGDSEPVPQN